MIAAERNLRASFDSVLFAVGVADRVTREQLVGTLMAMLDETATAPRAKRISIWNDYQQRIADIVKPYREAEQDAEPIQKGES